MADSGQVTDGGQPVTGVGHKLTDDGQLTYRWLFLADAVTDLNVSERTVRRRVTAGDLASRRADDGRVQIGIPLTDGGQPVTGGGHVTDTRRPMADSGQVTDGGQEMTGAGQTVTDVSHDDRSVVLSELTARIDRLDDDKAHLRDQLAEREQALRDAEASHAEAATRMRSDYDARLADVRIESAQRVESTKARIIDLERELTMRDTRMADMQDAHVAEVAELRGQVGILEAKVRSTLEERAEESGQLANRIADLVVAHTEMHARVVELQPVAERVPQLQAAVEETTAALTERERELGNIRNDIGAIASRPVTGPVFRLLTKGKLRR